MVDIKRVLHPTDFSDASSAALAVACSMVDKFGAELHLLHVIQDMTAIAPYGAAEAYLPVEWHAEARQLAEQTLDSLPVVLSTSVRLVRTVTEGSPYFEILEYCKANAIDLIVMGTHGRSGLPHLLLGSVAEKVIRAAPAICMTVRPAPK
jgi:nucleotide-binding universal stress UspA family protein